MKPNDLKYPFTWEQRRPLIHDSVFFVPALLDENQNFTFPGWSSRDVFGNDNPVFVEYCSGNGLWIAQKAEENPHINFVAVEKKFKRVKKIWSKIKNRKLNNLFVIAGEGFAATSKFLPQQSVDQIFINFPDPWPKDRHAKHRIVSEPFIDKLAKLIKQDGLLTMVTDDVTYSSQMVETMLACKGWSSSHPEPYYVTELAGYGSSYFEELWRSKGKQIHYHQFKKLP